MTIQTSSIVTSNENPVLLAQQIALANKLLTQAAEDAAKQIDKNPDNPKINRMAEGSFYISSKDIESNWSAFFYDWAAQYKRIAQLIMQQNFGALVSILDNGLLSGPNGKEHFAPEVVEKTRSIIGDLHAVIHKDIACGLMSRRHMKMG